MKKVCKIKFKESLNFLFPYILDDFSSFLDLLLLDLLLLDLLLLDFLLFDLLLLDLLLLDLLLLDFWFYFFKIIWLFYILVSGSFWFFSVLKFAIIFPLAWWTDFFIVFWSFYAFFFLDYLLILISFNFFLMSSWIFEYLLYLNFFLISWVLFSITLMFYSFLIVFFSGTWQCLFLMFANPSVYLFVSF